MYNPAMERKSSSVTVALGDSEPWFLHVTISVIVLNFYPIAPNSNSFSLVKNIGTYHNYFWRGLRLYFVEEGNDLLVIVCVMKKK